VEGASPGVKSFLEEIIIVLHINIPFLSRHIFSDIHKRRYESIFIQSPTSGKVKISSHASTFQIQVLGYDIFGFLVQLEIR
jgi:hypothetical protein